MDKIKDVNWYDAMNSLPPKDIVNESGYSVEVLITNGIDFLKSKVFYQQDGTCDRRWLMSCNQMPFNPTHWTYINFLP
jgi:hypothetical protein